MLDRAGREDADAADAVRLILLTGCRSGEILRLALADVQGDRLRPPRTKTVPRDVLLSAAARAALDQRSASAKTALVFPHPKDPTRPRGNIDRSWRRLRLAAGLPETVRLHDLRHTYASQALLQGETLAMAGKLLGHARTASTERYAHLERLPAGGRRARRGADRGAARLTQPRRRDGADTGVHWSRPPGKACFPGRTRPLYSAGGRSRAPRNAALAQPLTGWARSARNLYVIDAERTKNHIPP